MLQNCGIYKPSSAFCFSTYLFALHSVNIRPLLPQKRKVQIDSERHPIQQNIFNSIVKVFNIRFLNKQNHLVKYFCRQAHMPRTEWFGNCCRLIFWFQLVHTGCPTLWGDIQSGLNCANRVSDSLTHLPPPLHLQCTHINSPKVGSGIQVHWRIFYI